jgi:hypothetical protein
MYVSHVLGLRLNICATGLIILVENALMHILAVMAAFTTILFIHELRG